MSVSLRDSVSDLLCDEDSGNVLSEESQGWSSDDGIIVTELLRGEKELVEDGTQPLHRLSVEREEAVAWILKAHASFGFQPVTAYLSVLYMDRFLSLRCLPGTSVRNKSCEGWPIRLLSVACLSLAAKMEESLVPSLFDLQVEGARYVFEPRTIRRMELLVLTVLDWRLRSVTPFSFLNSFACRIDPTGTFVGGLVSRATEIILSKIHQDFGFLKYRPSCIAAAAVLCAASSVPSLSVEKPVNADSWFGGSIKGEVMRCYRLIANNSRRRYIEDSSPSSSSSSDPHSKRMRLSVRSWIVDDDDDKGISEPDDDEKE